MEDILLISAQSDDMLASMGLARSEERMWFEQALGFAPNDTRIKVICAAEEILPQSVDAKGIIIGGSAHSVYENTAWMGSLKEFILRMHIEGKAILGVCFGSQIIAEAFGGTVAKGVVGLEVGLVDIALTEQGGADLLFEGIHNPFPIYAYHSDAVTVLPEGAKVLAYNETYPHQAFGIGQNVRGVQFHPEIGRTRIERALEQRRGSLIDGRMLTHEQYEKIIRDLEVKEFDSVRKQILKNFYNHFVMLAPASRPVAQEA